MKTFILFMAIFSAIGTLSSMYDEDSWKDKSHLILAFITSVLWSIYITLL